MRGKLLTYGVERGKIWRSSQRITYRYTNAIRIGTSLMTPIEPLIQLWPKIQEKCPEIMFQIVSYKNTPENAQEILSHLGQDIDIVAGIFDETLLQNRKCAGLELSREPFYCALSLNHPLATKDKLAIQDLYYENFFLIHRGWSYYVDKLRDDLEHYYPQIHITDFDFYNADIFNRCASSNTILLVFRGWTNVHPLLKVIPVEWDYTIPYGLLHSPNPSLAVQKLLKAAQEIKSTL